MVSKEKFKTYGDVFDQRTLRALFKLACQGHFDELKSPISIGKESNVFSAVKKDGSLVCVKIYRVNTCDFNKMYNYIYADPRFMGLKKQKAKVIYAWAQREFRNLVKARKFKVRVPTPYAVHENVLVMEFIGGSEPAKLVKNDVPKDLKKFANKMLKDLINLYKAGMVHGDLSEFNLLNDNGKPVLIDLSHGVGLRYPNVRKLLGRDVRIILKFFRKYGLDLNDSKVMEMFK